MANKRAEIWQCESASHVPSHAATSAKSVPEEAQGKRSRYVFEGVRIRGTPFAVTPSQQRFDQNDGAILIEESPHCLLPPEQDTNQEIKMAKTKTATAKKNNEMNPDLATVSGVAAGAAVGSLLGPLGAAVGAMVGGVAGKSAGKNGIVGKSPSGSLMKKAASKVKSAAKKTNSVVKKATRSAKKSTTKAAKKLATKRTS
jgi:hypothetical protein